MTALPGLPEPSDAELVARVLTADRDAFATVYDRYGPRLYDFAYSMLRHREDAADAVADSFVTVAERLAQLRDPDRLRPWLYAVVRSECLRRLKARKRVAYGAEERLAEMADSGTTPERAAEQAALRDLVWDAAAGLADRDRALLDLHLRQGLEGAELGEAMGVTAANAYVMLNRLRAQVDRSLGALLIARIGQDDCNDLAALLTDWDGGFSPLVRKRVARHVDGCDTCGARRARMVTPWALLAAVPMFVAPVALRDRVVDQTRLVSFTTGLVPWWKRLLGPATFLGVMLLLGTVALLARPLADPAADSPGLLPEDQRTLVPGGVRPTDSPTSPTTPTGTAPTTPVVEPALLTASPGSIDFGARDVTATVTLGDAGGETLEWQVTSAPGWLSTAPGAGSLQPGGTAGLRLTADRSGLAEGRHTGTVVVASTGGNASIRVAVTVERDPVVGAPATGRAPSCSFPVRATVSDESGLSSVTLHWSGPGGSGTQAMSPDAGSYAGTAGPMAVGGDVRLWVTATDSRGNSATGPERTVYVYPCPQ